MPTAVPPELSPVQRRTLDALGAAGSDRPVFDEGLAGRLRSDLEAGLSPMVEDLGPDEDLIITKHALGQVHGCEMKFLATDGDQFAVTIPIDRGSVAHKAIELGIHWKGEPLPLELVDEALASLTEGEHWLTDFLQTASPAERAELRSTAGDRVAKFFECFPTLQPNWRPVTESSLRADLADRRVALKGKVDLTLGTAKGNRAGKVVIDLKTGGAQPIHRDDLRFYALIDTLRVGIPPRLIASFYLDSGRAETEAVTEGVLDAAVARTVDGAVRMAALRAGTTSPTLRPSYGCRWCPVLADCTQGKAWLASEDIDVGGEP